ncbi:MAG TPA: hypothetical protein VF190_06570 [Rhodothermales bacterium]
MDTPVPPPVRSGPTPEWEHFDLYQRIRDALHAVPSYFTSTIQISGVPATDIFNLNAILGAAIEERVVETLNSMRAVWDPDDRYPLYSFVRQAQTFPDVLLRNSARPTDILIGIELKGWYLLAKEGEPSFRFTASPRVCTPADLFVVYPWHLSEVISGVPRLLPPFIELARYVAERRNYHWQYEMVRRSGSSEIRLADVETPYPSKSDAISDVAVSDKGGNFGRIARTGIMSDFTRMVDAKLLSGIPAGVWRRFILMFKDASTAAAVERSLEQLAREVHGSTEVDADQLADWLAKTRSIFKVFG